MPPKLNKSPEQKTPERPTLPVHCPATPRKDRRSRAAAAARYREAHFRADLAGADELGAGVPVADRMPEQFHPTPCNLAERFKNTPERPARHLGQTENNWNSPLPASFPASQQSASSSSSADPLVAVLTSNKKPAYLPTSTQRLLELRFSKPLRASEIATPYEIGLAVERRIETQRAERERCISLSQAATDDVKQSRATGPHDFFPSIAPDRNSQAELASSQTSTPSTSTGSASTLSPDKIM